MVAWTCAKPCWMLGAKTTGTLGEQGGRIRMADVPCGNLPNRVLEPQFVL